MSQSKKSMNNSLVLLSPRADADPADNALSPHLHYMPLTPKPPSSEDPYGLGAFSNKKKTEEPVITKESLLEVKTEPSKKGGKANFFNKLKKSAGASKEEAVQKNEQNRVSEFELGSADQKEANGHSADPTPETQVPKEEPKTVKIQDKPKKKPKIIIQINYEEEINALKEELEILELQLTEEEDETAVDMWKKEISRVNEQIRLKTLQAETPKDVSEPAEPDSPKQKPTSRAEEIQEKPAPSPKSQDEKQAPQTDTPKVVDEAAAESKSKKKGKRAITRRLRVDAEQTEEQGKAQ